VPKKKPKKKLAGGKKLGKQVTLTVRGDRNPDNQARSF
jgi:hypothetical protein